jgi:hypothetical protein
MHEEHLTDPVVAIGVTLFLGGIMYLCHGTMVVYRKKKRVLVAFNIGRLSVRTLLLGLAAIGGGIGLLVVGQWGLG